MFTAYIKYISLLLISGLILTFYRATLPATHVSAKTLNVLKTLSADKQLTSFSVLNDVILPLFPVLNTGDLLPGNKK